jgi:hypothetical protein
MYRHIAQLFKISFSLKDLNTLKIIQKMSEKTDDPSNDGLSTL